MMAQIDKRQVAASFSRAAGSYDSVAELQRAVGERLMEQLPDQRFARVLDLGSGTGYFSQALYSGYAIEQLFGLDIAEGMLRFARRERGRAGMHWLCGDAENLPLADNSLDLIFSSLAIQWCENLPAVFAEAARALRPGGRFLFATLGPQTLKELRQAWAGVDGYVHVNRFTPLAAVREAAGQLQIESLESETRILHYAQLKELTSELKQLGAHNLNSGRQAGLTGRERVRAFKQAYEALRNPEGYLPATYEVYYGVVRRV